MNSKTQIRVNLKTNNQINKKIVVFRLDKRLFKKTITEIERIFHLLNPDLQINIKPTTTLKAIAQAKVFSTTIMIKTEDLRTDQNKKKSKMEKLEVSWLL